VPLEASSSGVPDLIVPEPTHVGVAPPTSTSIAAPAPAAPPITALVSEDPLATAILEPVLGPAPSVPSSVLTAPTSVLASTIVTRSRNNIHKPWVPSNDTILYDPDHCAFSVTSLSYRATLADDKWQSAMEAEFNALQANNTWTLVLKPSGQNIFSCKWVFRVKENYDGSIDKFKA
jgi:hypothetical protein